MIKLERRQIDNSHLQGECGRHRGAGCHALATGALKEERHGAPNERQTHNNKEQICLCLAEPESLFCSLSAISCVKNPWWPHVTGPGLPVKD
jgi:hypothetical protein